MIKIHERDIKEYVIYLIKRANKLYEQLYVEKCSLFGMEDAEEYIERCREYNNIVVALRCLGIYNWQKYKDELIEIRDIEIV